MASAWDRRSRSEQERIAGLVLDDWIEAAASFSSYWRDHFDRAGVDPARVDRAEDLPEIPSVRERGVVGAGGLGAPGLAMRPTEAQVKARAGTSILVSIARSIRGRGANKRRALLREYKPIHINRAGRDGRLAIAYSRTDLDRLHRAGARAAGVLGLDDGDYLVSAVPRGDGLSFWGLYHLALGTSLLATHPRGAGEPLARALEAFPLVPATVVAVPTGEAVELAAAITEAGVDIGRVKRVLVAGPPVGESKRQRIREAWEAAGAADEVEALAVWSPDVARALWAECAPGSGLHTYPDMEVVEVIDPATGEAGAGHGDLTYTSAGWHGTALIRFQTGTHVSLSRQPCPSCGRTVPRIAGPVRPGIWEPTLATGDGEVVIDLRGAGLVMRKADLGPWRLELRRARDDSGNEGYVVHVGTEPPDRQRLRHDLERELGLLPTDVLIGDAETIRSDIDDDGVYTDRR